MSESTAHTGRRALVIGGGPGGLSAAAGLRRAGLDVSVFERATDLRHVQLGGGVHLWNNALRALDEVGLADRVRDAGVPVERFVWWTSAGRLIGEGDVAELTRRLGVPALGLTRSDLHEALTAGLGGVSVETGAEFTGFSEDAGGVAAAFADGREARGDVLVGADGAGSAVRTQLLGETELRYSGVVNLQAVVTGLTDLTPSATYGMFWGRGIRLGFYPVRGGTFWYALVSTDSGGPDAPGGFKQYVLERVRGWAEPAPALVEATPDEAVVRSDLVGRDPVDIWGRGRVTLLGDAAHAMTPFMGQGAGQALEDAAVLLRCLREEASVEQALRRYEERRQPRTAEVTTRSWRVGQGTKMANPLACAVRNRIVRLLYPRVVWPQFAKQIAHDF
jgi:2-polyprenyl-6-methoxyphenol hydroxylase-like FAD-dependent oxidoreductase